MNDEMMIAYGDAIKALGDGKVGGRLVRFSTQNDPDATIEYFDTKTDLGEPNKLPVLYHHGLDAKVGKRRIGTATTRIDEVGLWAEAQLNLRDEYEKTIYAMAEAGKLGWSSGAAAHAVTRTHTGKATHIDQWYISEASLTPTPAEWRNSVVTLKSLELPEADAKTAAATETKTSAAIAAKENEMDEKELQALMDKRDADKAAKAQADTDAKAALDMTVKTAVESALKGVVTPANEAGIKTINTKKETDFGSDDGTKAFLHYIRTGKINSELKFDMQGQTDSEGGYAVPDDFYNQIVAKRDQVSVIRKTGAVFYPTTLDRILVPVEGTSATKFVVTAEEGTYDNNEPSLGQVICVIHKLTKTLKISEELETDAKANFGPWLANMWGRAMGLAENYYFFNVAANGSGVPQSATHASTLGNTAASQTVTTAAELNALVYAMPSAYTDNLKLVMRRSTLGGLRGLASSSVFTFNPTPGGTGGVNTADGSAGDLFGIPVYLTDELPAQAAASVKHILLFNPDFYFVGEREAMSVSRNPYLYQANGQIGLFAKFREGAVATLATGFLHLASLA